LTNELKPLLRDFPGALASLHRDNEKAAAEKFAILTERTRSLWTP
jgi:hypothetical protein